MSEEEQPGEWRGVGSQTLDSLDLGVQGALQGCTEFLGQIQSFGNLSF